MTIYDKRSITIEDVSENFSKILRIIDKLAGEESSLKINIQELKFNIGKTKSRINGEIQFDITHSK